jgi:hypothetical protein
MKGEFVIFSPRPRLLESLHKEFANFRIRFAREYTKATKRAG